MKVQLVLILTELNHSYASFAYEDQFFALNVQDWVKLDRPVRITVTVEKL